MTVEGETVSYLIYRYWRGDKREQRLDDGPYFKLADEADARKYAMEVAKQQKRRVEIVKVTSQHVADYGE